MIEKNKTDERYEGFLILPEHLFQPRLQNERKDLVLSDLLIENNKTDERYEGFLILPEHPFQPRLQNERKYLVLKILNNNTRSSQTR